MKKYFYIGGAVLAAITILSTYFTVEQNKAAVITTFGKFSSVADPGLHFVVPFVQSYQEFPTDIQHQCSTDKSPDLINTYTRDSQEVDVSWCAFYRITLANLPFIFESNRDYQNKLTNLITDRLKVVFGQVIVEQVAEHRGKIRDDIYNIVKKDAEGLGLTIVGFQLPNLEYGKTFRDAVAQAAVQKANIERIQYMQDQEKKVAETAKIKADGEANAVRSAAQGKADAIRYEADANAHQIEVKGAAEAKAIQAQGEALNKNPRLVEWKQAGQGWDGRLPNQMFGSAPLPFFNIDKTFYGSSNQQAQTKQP